MSRKFRIGEEVRVKDTGVVGEIDTYAGSLYLVSTAKGMVRYWRHSSELESMKKTPKQPYGVLLP